MAKSGSRRLERWTQLLILVLSLGAMAALWTVFLVSALADRDSQQALEAEKLTRSARLLESGLDHLLGESRLALEILTRQSEAHPGVDLTQSAEFRTLIDTVRHHADGYLDVRGVAPTGEPVRFEETAGSGSRANELDFLPLTRRFAPGDFVVAPPQISEGRWAIPLTQGLPPASRGLSRLYILVGFDQVDELVGALGTRPGETLSVYRTEGTLLYRHPLPREFPYDQRPGDWTSVQRTGRTSGVVDDEEVRAFLKGEETGVWVVVSRPRSAVLAAWDAWFGGQLVWIGLLTLGFGGAAGGLVFVLRRLNALRKAQEELARVDPLTGLPNRRAFWERCHAELKKQGRQPSPLSLALFDLDHFKQINDRFGHLAGDQALKDFAGKVGPILRASDTLARIGGEEFALLLPATRPEDAHEIADRVRREVEGVSLPEGHLTTSAGWSVWKDDETFDQWYHRADQALYQAKHTGRNRVVAAG